MQLFAKFKKILQGGFRATLNFRKFTQNSWAANSYSNLKDVFFKFGVGVIDLCVDFNARHLPCLEAVN